MFGMPGQRRRARGLIRAPWMGGGVVAPRRSYSADPIKAAEEIGYDTAVEGVRKNWSDEKIKRVAMKRVKKITAVSTDEKYVKLYRYDDSDNDGNNYRGNDSNVSPALPGAAAHVSPPQNRGTGDGSAVRAFAVSPTPAARPAKPAAVMKAGGLRGGVMGLWERSA